VADNDLLNWNATIIGPDSSAWEGGLFSLSLQFTEEFPDRYASLHLRYSFQLTIVPVEDHQKFDLIQKCSIQIVREGYKLGPQVHSNFPLPFYSLWQWLNLFGHTTR